MIFNLVSDFLEIYTSKPTPAVDGSRRARCSTMVSSAWNESLCDREIYCNGKWFLIRLCDMCFEYRYIMYVMKKIFFMVLSWCLYFLADVENSTVWLLSQLVSGEFVSMLGVIFGVLVVFYIKIHMCMSNDLVCFKLLTWLTQWGLDKMGDISKLKASILLYAGDNWTPRKQVSVKFESKLKIL